MDLMHDRLAPAAHEYNLAIPHAADRWRSRMLSALTGACMRQITATCSLAGDGARGETMDNRLLNAWTCMDRLLAWRELGDGAVPAACRLKSAMLRRRASILTSDGTYRMATSRGPIATPPQLSV